MKNKLIYICMITCLFLSGCDPFDAQVSNALDAPVYIELKTAAGETLSRTIAPKSSLDLVSTSETVTKRHLVFCKIQVENRTWIYTMADIIRLSKGKKGVELWKIDDSGLSRK